MLSLDSSPNLNHCDCGLDLGTAEAHGYIYDHLATAWLPAHCRDDELTANFDCAGPGVMGPGLTLQTPMEQFSSTNTGLVFWDLQMALF
jgi:hypothetical protein